MEWFDQFVEQLWRAWAYLTTSRVLAIVLGVGFALLAIGLFVASRTKWGRAKPLTKFVVVSVVLHVWLLMYALGSRKILPQGDPRGREQAISVSFDGGDMLPTIPALENFDTTSSSASTTGAESPTSPLDAPTPLDDLPVPDGLNGVNLSKMLEVPALLPAIEPTPMPSLPPLEELTDMLAPEPASPTSDSYETAPELADDNSEQDQPFEPDDNEFPPPSMSNFASSQDSALSDIGPPIMPPADTRPREITSPSKVMRSVGANQQVVSPEQQLPESKLPREYRLRQAPNRLQLSRAFGADADSEAAVKAGLDWLARSQSDNGSWDAAAYGAGTETMALGENRHGTGSRADTGISGLAMLAFLSAGHTHLDGEYRDTVRRGLEYLMGQQMASGDMSGPKQVGNAPSVLNSRMYCHSISTLALAEAYAMTLDAGLRESLLRAAQYSINAQDARSGGWRYKPGESGDLSQFGWQAMALKSVERSGIPIPQVTTRRMQRFLDSCAAGRVGGLATYRPRQGRPSDTMTAESLACRLLLDYPLSMEAQREATQMIMNNRPGVGEDNVYFWYYATLALFQLQDENWRAWNAAMKTRLLETQAPAYDRQPGSWEPDRMWGGYGGRVYSTAMSCLCLEVYYRYLPMYQHSNVARTRDRLSR